LVRTNLVRGGASGRAGMSHISNHSSRHRAAIAVVKEFSAGSVTRTMKKASQFATICIAFSLTYLTACVTTGDRSDPVRQKFAAFDRHDVSAIESLYATDAVLHSPDYPLLQGNTSIAETYQRLFKAIPDARDELQRLDVCGDRVYAQFLLTGHWLGATDKPIRLPILSVYSIRGGHIAADSTYYDRKAP